MKRYYSITILAIIVITLLQGYYISLQYKDYLHYKIEKIMTHSIYCLTMAQYCPLLGQLFAISGHKVMRREKIFGRSIIAIRNMLSDCRKRGFARKNLTLDFTLHPSPFRRKPR